MDTKVKGLVLYSKDTGESDKFVTILTPDVGKIFFKARGVKKANSKLKAFVQSFSFCNFELNEKNGNYTLTGAQSIESFFGLTTDLDKYNIGCIILETLDKVCSYAQNYSKTFISALKSLKNLSYSDVDGKLILCKYLLEVLVNEGFAFDLNICAICRKSFNNNMFFSFTENTIVCESCREVNSVAIKPATISAIKILKGCDYDNLSTIKLNDFVLDGVFKFLIISFCNTFETKLKTLSLLD